MLNVSVCDGMGGSWERGVMGNNCPIYPIFPPPLFFYFEIQIQFGDGRCICCVICHSSVVLVQENLFQIWGKWIALVNSRTVSESKMCIGSTSLEWLVSKADTLPDTLLSGFLDFKVVVGVLGFLWGWEGRWEVWYACGHPTAFVMFWLQND